MYESGRTGSRQDIIYKQYSSFGLFSEPRSCVKVEEAVLGSPSQISLMVSVDIKQD